MNNDTEVIEGGWLSSMLSFCQREDVGAVGAKLLYPDDTVQHAGVMMIYCNNEGEMGGPIHVFNNLDRNDPGYMRRAVISQDLSAVTAACMMTKRSVFEELNGFNEDFEVAFNDVDFCLRVRLLDKLVVSMLMPSCIIMSPSAVAMRLVKRKSDLCVSRANYALLGRSIMSTVTLITVR